MGISEREHHIKVLENLLSYYKAREKCEGYYDSTLKDNVEALQYAISSLKTDESYQIMYEGGEIFTKDEVIAMLTDLRLEIEKIFDNRPLPCSHYQRTLFYGEVDDLILDKINELKGESENKE
jgi:hypothetical protein